jgi:hypothetical protein
MPQCSIVTALENKQSKLELDQLVASTVTSLACMSVPSEDAVVRRVKLQTTGEELILISYCFSTMLILTVFLFTTKIQSYTTIFKQMIPTSKLSRY